MPLIARLRHRLQADARLSSIFKGSATAIAGKGLTIVVNAITLPLTIRYLGKLEYGIWVTISTSVVMLAVLDLGIANTLTNFISRAYAEGDDSLAQRYFATALWITVGIACILALTGTVIFRWIDWGSVFRLTDPHLIAMTRTCVAIAFAFFLLSLPLNLARNVFSGYQEIHLANYFAAIASVMGLVAIVGTVLLHGTLVTLTASYCAATLLGVLLLNIWLCFWHRPAIAPVPSAITRSMARDLFGEGALFFLLQIHSLIIFNSDNLVIAHFLGAAEVTPYSVTWRLCSYASMFQTLLIPSLWPAFSEAYHRADLTWIRKTYSRIVRGTLTAVCAAALILGLLGRPLIRIWAGSAAVPSSLLLWLMCGWVLLLACGLNQAVLLSATSRIRLQAAYSIIGAAANLALSIYLVRLIGTPGVLIGTLVSYILFGLAPQGYEVRNILRGDYLTEVAPAC
ncbi:MAG TPA: oligosaccharide flippase family protein [Acidobacteriaceae bacterium]|nr:oligosaccharide flippase family protein [Acidobacteriaceae bacterium]